MNKANLKSYAPQAIKDFITGDTAPANLRGGSPVREQGDIGGRIQV